MGADGKYHFFSLESDGGLIAGDDKLLEHATNYYKNLFGPAEGNCIPLDEGMWEGETKLSESDNEHLCRPFSEEEIKFALFQLEHNKAAGPDNIPIEFY